MDIEKTLKKKRMRKYFLIVIAVILLIGIIAGFKIESNKYEEKQAGNVPVTYEIRCDVLAENKEKLVDKALEAYVPDDGVILAKTEYKAEKGESVYDGLYELCRKFDIQIESSFTPIYESYYIEAINHLYEFHGGKGSGWMYTVNGEFPNKGCSALELKKGDEVVFMYTCNLGEDVGGKL